MSKYAEKLLDPRWQKRRLEILERDKWTCRIGSETHKSLQVHHAAYLPGVEPWDHPDHLLMTLCCDCHAKETREKAMADLALLHAFRNAGALNADVRRIALIISECSAVNPGSVLAELNFATDEIWTRMVGKKRASA